jgi:hypothetical protein
MTGVNNNVVPFNPSQVPAHLRNTELSAATKALMGSSSGFRLSIKGGVWRLLSNGKEYAKLPERELDVVVVAAAEHVSRVFYMKKWDDDAPPEAPDCVSRDGTAPDARSPHKQAERCDACPQNVKGSGQGDSKACRYNQALAVVLANDITGNVLKFQVPAASVFGKGEGGNVPLREYVTQLASVAPPVNIDTVVTRMTFDLDVSSPKLFFKPVRFLSTDEYATALKQGKTDAAKRAIETTVFEADTAKPAPVIAGASPVAAAPKVPEPEPEPEETEEEREQREYAEFKAAKAAKAGNGESKPKATRAKKEAAAEPTVRAAPAAAPTPGRANLNNILAQWGEPETGTDD